MTLLLVLLIILVLGGGGYSYWGNGAQPFGANQVGGLLGLVLFVVLVVILLRVLGVGI